MTFHMYALLTTYSWLYISLSLYQKSDISCVKNSRAFNVLIHLNSPGIHSLLVSDSVGIMSSSSLLHFHSRIVMSTLPQLLSIYLELVAMLHYCQSSHLNC